MGNVLRRRIISKPDAVTLRRIERGITVDELAEFARISRAQVYNIESGVQGTTEQTARHIARALGCDFGDLFEIQRPENGRTP